MNSITQVGIDVSKDTLRIDRDGMKQCDIANSKESLDALAQELPPSSVIQMESTGGYERLARRILEGHGHEVRVLNPRKARRFADAMTVTAKTDAIDARFLKEHGHKLPGSNTKSVDHEELTDISRSIHRLKKSISNHKKYMRQSWLCDEIVEIYRELVRSYEEQIKALEKLFERKVKNSAMKTRYELAQSVPGVGKGLARVAVCELAECLDNLSGPKACSYCGIAPLDNGSGKKDAPKYIGRGNHHLKAALFMPALSAIRHQPWAHELYTKILAKGKSHQQAMIAIMRRFLLRIFTVIKRGTPWQEVPPNYP